MNIYRQEQMMKEKANTGRITPHLDQKIRRNLSDKHILFRIAEIFGVMSDPARLAILVCLEQSELCVSDIMSLTGLPQSSVSHHLRNLRQLEIVKYRKDGKMIFYRLSDSYIPALIAIARDHLRDIQ